MGGRLDATNVIVPECCVLTSLGRIMNRYWDLAGKNRNGEGGDFKEGSACIFRSLAESGAKDLGISSEEVEVSMEGGETVGSGKGSTAFRGSSPKAKYGACDCRWKVFGVSGCDYSEGIGANCLAGKIYAAEGTKSAGVGWSSQFGRSTRSPSNLAGAVL